MIKMIDSKIIEFIKNWKYDRNSFYCSCVQLPIHINQCVDENNNIIIFFTINKNIKAVFTEYLKIGIFFENSNENSEYKIQVDTFFLDKENLEIILQFEKDFNNFMRN